MTFPIDLHIHGVVIPSHLIFDWLSLAIAYKYYEVSKNTNTDSLSTGNRWTILISAAVGGFFGAHLLAVFEQPTLVLHQSWLYYFADKTIIGFLAGAIIAVEIVKKIIHETKSSGDLFTYPIILGIIVGRIGCFLTGITDDTVGLPTHLPWAINQGDGIPRHPTSLYEIIFLLVLWWVLRRIQKHSILQSGTLFRLFIFSYFSLRFFIEFVKPIQPVFIGLSTIQIVCAAIALYYLVEIIFLIKNKKINILLWTPKNQI